MRDNAVHEDRAMKHMRTGRKATNGTPLFYVTVDGERTGRNCTLTNAIKRADLYGMAALVYKLGTCTGPVHIGGYE
jgi:hypothetical protein